ncbi:MAG TPA: hypothetical protein VFQ53_02895 [Kofleriaceae bacterium]|nr:hypothetical protein [Kofleriaceae bacterium]
MTLLALSLALTTATACKKKKPADTAGSGSDTTAMGSNMGSGSAGSGSDTMAGSGSDMAGSGSDMGSGSAMAGSGSAGGDVTMSHQAQNCPSTVAGSETKAAVKGKDVVLTITAKDKDAIAMVQKRTEDLLKEKSDAATGSGHDQKGTQGGGKGICPVYWTEGGTAKSKKDAKGVTITITPKEKPEDLKKTIDERITKAADWVKANPTAGGGAGSAAAGSGAGSAGGTGGGAGTGGGGGKGTGGGSGKGSGSAKAGGT